MKGAEANVEHCSTIENQSNYAFKQGFDDENVQQVFAHDSVKVSNYTYL